MDKIDSILEEYEENLKKAEEGKCIKVTKCTDFRNHFINESFKFNGRIGC